MALIDGELNIFHSLRPKHIIVRDNNIVVISALCLNKSLTNTTYLAPEELNPEIAAKMDP